VAKNTKKKSRNYKVLASVVLAVVIFISVNVIGSLSLNKYDIDLTEGNMFTISKGSKSILHKMEEPITLNFFYSNSVANGIPIMKSYAARIRGVLEDYEKYSNGNIKLNIIDPKPFSEEEDLALSYGIKGIKIDHMGTKAYIGLAASNSVDEVKVIPVFALEREKHLEYEVSRIIYDLNNAKRKKVGFVSSIRMTSKPFMGVRALGGASDLLILQQIKQTFDVVDLGVEHVQIPDDIDVLVVVQPKDFSENTLYAIDQYVMKGGRVLFFADPNKEGAGTGNPDDRSFSMAANRLLTSWGVRIHNDRIVADRKVARKFNKGSSPKETWNLVNYLPWLNLREDNINKEDLITSLLKTINVNSTGYVENLGFLEVDIVPLLQSSEDSMIIPVKNIRPSKDPEKLLRDFIPDPEKYTIAAKITGSVKTSFSDKARNPGHITVARDKAHIIVVADTDILMQDNWAEMSNYDGHKVVNIKASNADFIINALDHLSGSSELMSLRGRGALSRPFTVVEELRRNSEEEFVAKQEELSNKLAETEKKLSELQKMAQINSENSLLYKKQQQIEIKRFTDEMVEVKKETRKLKGELRKDIEKLGTKLKIINIWLMPVLISLFAIFIFFIKSSTRAKKISNSV